MKTDDPTLPREPDPPVFSVSELNRLVADLLDAQVAVRWVVGEISNLTRYASGHWYFTLKDDSAQVRAVMFRARAQSLGFEVKDGDRVEVRAAVTLYSARGEYQLNVETIRRAGVGKRYEAFLRLKDKLAKEGLFSPERKQPLPVFPTVVGIVTSREAAALRDVLTTLRRRTPHIRIILYPTPVQGEGAHDRIAAAIATAARRAEADVLIICRGGGSIEDLWSFNEECVARAIAACPIPVIAGVGHETDITITDFVADVRAPTPTGAAEMLTQSRKAWMDAIGTTAETLSRIMRRLLSHARQTNDMTARRLISPAAYVARERKNLHWLASRLSGACHQLRTNARHLLSHNQTRLCAVPPHTAQNRLALDALWRRMARAAMENRNRRHQQVHALSDQLALLSPARTLERGYAIVTNKAGQIIRSPFRLPVREAISIRFASGAARVNITHVQPDLLTDETD
ncbi:MAG: exodeoxyribonuclease VII large subunit [Burkholderiaceae bacterium]|jgi:exodeoxyribonuclease VII large subunit|nr:exodeoxyribonuclease VII large subunit [Burkholderiaceae bacterium]